MAALVGLRRGSLRFPFTFLPFALVLRFANGWKSTSLLLFLALSAAAFDSPAVSTFSSGGTLFRIVARFCKWSITIVGLFIAVTSIGLTCGEVLEPVCNCGGRLDDWR